MPEITVNINDQNYAIVCDPGEENHLKQLSSKIDTKVRELTGRFGKIGETRLMVMAALLIADEVQDLNSNLEKGIQKIEELETLLKSKDQELVNNETGKYLHRFGWLKDNEIGQIGIEWNWLVGWYDNEKIKPKAIHFTEGGPWLNDNYKTNKYAELWLKMEREFNS